MKKYSARFPAPCPFHSASPQAKSWNEKTAGFVVVLDDGRVFYKIERHAISLPSRAPTGLWREKTFGRFETLEGWLALVEAQPAEFVVRASFLARK